MTFSVHTIESAPSGSKPTLEAARDALGFVPNLYGVMAEAPALLEGYKALSAVFEKSSLTATERQIVLLMASYDNGCEYCVAAHSTIAAMQRVPDEVISAIRDGERIEDPKLEALRQFTSAVVTKRGWPDEAEVTDFLNAGYGRAQILEVVLGVGIKTLSNYTNHVADTPLDQAFAPNVWKKAA